MIRVLTRAIQTKPGPAALWVSAALVAAVVLSWNSKRGPGIGAGT